MRPFRPTLRFFARWALPWSLLTAACTPGFAAPPGAAGPTPVAAPAESPPDPPSPPHPPALPPIRDHLIPWTAEREALTEAYLQAHRTAPLSGNPEVDTRMVPRAIVLHWTAGPTAASAWATFAPDHLAGRDDLRAGGDLNVGAHYVVDRDGTIERLFPDDRVVRHCIGLNHLAIGVENVGGDAAHPLTAAQVAADIALIRGLAARYPIEVLLGHLEYRRMEGSPLFEERDPAYRTTKPDPGAAFMASVRAGLTDLPLAEPPKGR